jgi:hypothetical protein
MATRVADRSGTTCTDPAAHQWPDDQKISSGADRSSSRDFECGINGSRTPETEVKGSTI